MGVFLCLIFLKTHYPLMGFFLLYIDHSGYICWCYYLGPKNGQDAYPSAENMLWKFLAFQQYWEGLFHLSSLLHQGRRLWPSFMGNPWKVYLIHTKNQPRARLHRIVKKHYCKKDCCYKTPRNASRIYWGMLLQISLAGHVSSFFPSSTLSVPCSATLAMCNVNSPFP